MNDFTHRIAMFAGLALAGPLVWFGMRQVAEADQKAFRELVTDKGLTSPRQVWDAAQKRHRQVRKELGHAKAQIEAAKDLVRVAWGLAKVREMMNEGSNLTPAVHLKQLFGVEVTDTELQRAIADFQRKATPIEVKRAIIAHWWTELFQLFVPWGIVVPDEIDVEEAFFRIVGDDVREAVLRAEVHRYKDLYERYKRIAGERLTSFSKACQENVEERKVWKAKAETDRATIEALRRELIVAKELIEGRLAHLFSPKGSEG